jgi:hypothetical protein
MYLLYEALSFEYLGNSPTRAGEEGFEKRSFAHRITARDLQVLSEPLEKTKP